ncbi:hypothetical protein ACK3SF_00945 [Candidatus Nanosalina sp. VS9-1]|uniref:hypothetical protein n=1 Tax=Candidatus Nanosalina sp. VS9-1 TaxID=3388566 RepID=UPI0039E1E710
MSENFQGNIPVSMAKQVFRGMESGRTDFVKQAVVDKGLPVRDEGDLPVSSNSEILFGKFPEEYAVKGLLHDAAVNLYAREQDFRDLGVDPSEQEIIELLEGSIDGTGSATPELRHRVNELETKYDLRPDELLQYSFGDRTVSDMLQELAEHRSRNWQQDTAGFSSIEAEVPVFQRGLSGRMDLVLSGEQDQVRELKMKDSGSREDEFQASAYWLIAEGEPEIVLEYPLTDERLSFDPDSDVNDFDPREYAFDVYRSRDRAVELVEELRGLQSKYFDFYDSREKATREALKELEV